LYTITKPQKKLKATPNAVDLAMDLLLSSQARKHRGESAYPQKAFCSSNSSFAVSLLMSKQLVRMGIQTN